MSRYEFFGDQVLREVEEMPPEAQVGFAALLEGLQDDPQHLPKRALLGVQEFKDPVYPYCYTAPFGGGQGLLMYQVKQDYPKIWLRKVLWLDPLDDDEG